MQNIEIFRQQFWRARREWIEAHDLETLDQGCCWYQTEGTDEDLVLTDAFPPAGSGGLKALMAEITQWWRGRLAFKSELHPVGGLYAHYLPEMGFDWSVEFEGEKAVRAWRMDGRGKAVELKIPEDDEMFHDQMGTHLDVKAGWRKLCEAWHREERLKVTEVEAGYLCGIRKGDPEGGDPASREEPDMGEAFSAYDPQAYDTLEFLSGADAVMLPFEAERIWDWLGDDAEAARKGEIELFVLASSAAFEAHIDDLMETRGFKKTVRETGEGKSLRFSMGDVYADFDFDEHYLRTLHTGRSFAQGVRDFVCPLVDLVEDAADMMKTLRWRLKGSPYKVELTGGSILTISQKKQKLGQWNLLALGGRTSFRGQEGEKRLLRLLGFDPETMQLRVSEMNLRECPCCGQDARVSKRVRPRALLGIDPRTLVYTPMEDFIVYYVLECPAHTIPLTPSPACGIQALEAAYRESLPQAQIPLVMESKLPSGGHLFVGSDIGSILLEPCLMRKLWDECGHGEPLPKWGYAFYADTLVLSASKLENEDLLQAQRASLEAVTANYQGRTWPCNHVKAIDLEVEPMGYVEKL